MLPAILHQSTQRMGSVSPWGAVNASPTSLATALTTDGLASRIRLDLLPHVTGDSLMNLGLDSPFVSLLKEAAKDKLLWAETLQKMGTLARPSPMSLRTTNATGGTGKSAHPPDLSLAILASLIELYSQKSEVSKTRITSLSAAR